METNEKTLIVRNLTFLSYLILIYVYEVFKSVEINVNLLSNLILKQGLRRIPRSMLYI